MWPANECLNSVYKQKQLRREQEIDMGGAYVNTCMAIMRTMARCCGVTLLVLPTKKIASCCHKPVSNVVSLDSVIWMT